MKSVWGAGVGRTVASPPVLLGQSTPGVSVRAPVNSSGWNGAVCFSLRCHSIIMRMSLSIILLLISVEAVPIHFASCVTHIVQKLLSSFLIWDLSAVPTMMERSVVRCPPKHKKQYLKESKWRHNSILTSLFCNNVKSQMKTDKISAMIIKS